jgi:signal transduction histidine kinase
MPAGVALTALLWRGAQLWPGIMIGSLVANLAFGAPAAVALAIASGSTAEQLVAYTLLTRVVDFRPELSRTKDVLGLVLSALLSPILSATVGVATLWFSDLLRIRSVGYVWYVWWTGHAMGILVVTPLLLTWTARPRKRLTLEHCALWGAIMLTGVVVFGDILPSGIARVVPPSYLVFPPLIWGALRLGPRWTATAVALLSGLAITASLLGYSRFAETNLTDRLLAVQAFMAIVAITIAMLSAAIAERNERDQVISIASHELRNPLGTLTLHYQLLTHALKVGLGREQLEAALAKVQRSLARLTQLVDELLDVSRIVQGPIALRTEQFDLRELTELVASRLAPDLERNGSMLDLRLEPTTGSWDRSRLDQVITNLITNASKYGGAQPITVTLSPRPGCARLEVRDRGPGIAHSDQQRIFDPFVRLGDRAGAAGMGLGLAICREIVRAHRGRIWVESRLGAGSRFIIELPRNPEARLTEKREKSQRDARASAATTGARATRGS